jgi:hypothetical protein
MLAQAHDAEDGQERGSGKLPAHGHAAITAIQVATPTSRAVMTFSTVSLAHSHGLATPTGSKVRACHVWPALIAPSAMGWWPRTGALLLAAPMQSSNQVSAFAGRWKLGGADAW